MCVNAERGMAYGSSTFEESESLGLSVNGICETLRAGDLSKLSLTRTALMGTPEQSDGLARRAGIALGGRAYTRER
jgi:hypothetical protein